MIAAERSDTDIDAQLAAEFCRELKLRVAEMKSALAMWRTARDAREAARDAVEPAKKRAWAAQLRDAADADEMTRRFEEARDGADRARRELAAAKQRVGEAVEAAESDALRMGNVTLRGEAAVRVERMAYVTTGHARAARDEAGLGRSPEDVERQRRSEREAAERVAEAAPAPAAAEPVATAVTSTASASAAELTREARVLGLLAQDPTIAVAELARRVGVDRRTLYRWPKVKAALAVRRAGRGIRQVRGRSLAEAAADDDESPRIARSSRSRRRRNDS